MKAKRLSILLLTAVMLFIFATSASATTNLNQTDTRTGQGSLKVSGYVYVNGGGGVVIAKVYRTVNGVEEYVKMGSRVLSPPSSGSGTVSFDFTITGLPQDTYKIKYSYGGNLSSLTINSYFI
ncbi:hypothetical protein I6N90_12955 [Paenibacillus sp. GSMTC-2017]|uniref:hypothetical protein n=1 Tax=Paenibacillus sp. GSMTC-2017 TaxID=2794350 RepID=UPI0018D6DC98|nr:hypothetical protein [Paenibacillus sp. GSMTC-2017]MBH5318708.1 hypothetical protein [Paenibacillus sp. GSMTC-2017]